MGSARLITIEERGQLISVVLRANRRAPVTLEDRRHRVFQGGGAVGAVLWAGGARR
jgi:hypothetical protein